MIKYARIKDRKIVNKGLVCLNKTKISLVAYRILHDAMQSEGYENMSYTLEFILRRYKYRDEAKVREDIANDKFEELNTDPNNEDVYNQDELWQVLGRNRNTFTELNY